MMPILRDSSLNKAARCPSTSIDPQIPYAPPARCIDCQCHLSKYRARDETRCAPCHLAREKRLGARDKPPCDRYDRARTMLAVGATFGEVAHELGWASSASACSAVRHYEERNGLPRAGRTKPGGNAKRDAA